jgi:hypothetical protein
MASKREKIRANQLGAAVVKYCWGATRKTREDLQFGSGLTYAEADAVYRLYEKNERNPELMRAGSAEAVWEPDYISKEAVAAAILSAKGK